MMLATYNPYIYILNVSISKIVNTSNIFNISGKFPESFLKTFRQKK